jgi:tungstate transport system substrate-binding protein
MRTKLAAIIVLIIAMMFLSASAQAQPKIAGSYGLGPEKFSLATGSPGELGLLKALGEAFSKEMGGKTTLNWIKAGSGASLKDTPRLQ